MKKYINPASSVWSTDLSRPTLDNLSVADAVTQIINQVKAEGDHALVGFAQRFDNLKANSVEIGRDEWEGAERLLPAELKQAIEVAYKNIYTFHAAQLEPEMAIETMPGVLCRRKSVPIERVGLYIPGGTAPLFSTALMLGVPAQVAKCQHIVACSPCQADGTVHPATLYAAKLSGVKTFYKMGGAHAIAAFAYGTQSVAAVHKIFGPGNRYVTFAKMFVQQHGVAIDMPAGPSEVLIYANKGANPAYVAADLLSQAEHGTDSQCMLVTLSEKMTDDILTEVYTQLELLPRKDIALKALENSKAVVFNNVETAFAFINQYAPEHLIVADDHADQLSHLITAAGSVFLGHLTPESVGDYASGTNHSLPTNGFAKAYSGTSTDSFIKKITFQSLTKSGLENIGSTVELLADAEGLQAHKNAVTIRLKNIQ